jgi:hypothetical protein
MPALGAVGLAVKAYLVAHHELGGSNGDPAAIGGFRSDVDDPTKYLDRHWLSMMRDVARFVPEIVELAAPVIGRQPPSQPGGSKVPLRPR